MLSAAEIAELVGGDLKGGEGIEVDHAAPLDTAGETAVSFIGSPKYLADLAETGAGVVIVSAELAGHVPDRSATIVAAEPQAAFRKVLLKLHPEAPPGPGIDPSARISSTARVDESARVGAFAVIEDDAVVGARCRIGPHVVIGARCRLAEDVRVEAGATLYSGVDVGPRAVIHSGARVGKPGFGFVWDEGAHRRVPQIGGCRIGADVEIGANSTVDRGALGDTVIGAGTKIDNLVHIGHNVQIGEHVIIIAQVGVSGSTRIGDGAILAGQAGISGHLEIGTRARVGAQSGVIGDIPAGETVSGYPARPHREALRAQAGLFKLPEVLKRLRKVEELLERMKR